MDKMNFDLDDVFMSSPGGIGELQGIVDNSHDVFGSSDSSLGSVFDEEHPIPSYEELRNAGFNDYLARNISEGGCHSYSDEELFHVLYESEDPVAAYNEMMDAKAHDAIDKADALIDEIENSGLLGSSYETPFNDEISHYNAPVSPDGSEDEQELGLADCWPLCKALTGEVSNNADYGFHA